MKTIRGSVSTNKVGSRCTFEFEVDDDITEEEIEGFAQQAAFELVDWNYAVEES